ncbi:MAG: lipopolysaccharide transport periplasmic protein LptA [Desulfarculaceae bacterium]|jgi:lipopolysaccharide export system protein LptA
MKFWPLPTLLIILVATITPAAWGFKTPTASDQPIHVVADKLEVDNLAQVGTFTGSVKAVQGDVTITCDKLEVYYLRDDQEQKEKATAPEEKEASQGLVDEGAKIRKVVALGHVKIVQQDRVAVGRKATYWAGGRKVLLEGQATVWRGKNQVSGQTITVFLDQDRSVVHGKPGKRVSVTIAPKKTQKKK